MAALQASLAGPEAAEWLASLRLDPPEEERADVRHALLMEMLVALLGAKGRKPKAADFYDALPWRNETPTAPVTQAQLAQKVNAVMAMFGGKR